MIANIQLLFDFQVPKNLDSTLLDVWINSPKCSFFRVGQWFDFTNFITEKQNPQQYVVLYTEMSCTLVFYNVGIYFLEPVARNDYGVALTKVFFEPDFLAFRPV